MKSLYTCTVESILTGCLAVVRDHDNPETHRDRSHLPVDGLTAEDPSHPVHLLFTLMKSAKG